VETEKRNSLIKAWEENEKTKAENKASKKLSAILSWENTKKANIEAQLKKIEVYSCFCYFCFPSERYSFQLAHYLKVTNILSYQ
jgi:hypothetical protein